MTEKQKYLLKLFREVDEICREHNLRYVLAGGSLIGALRHEGFVPWDDDVDHYMPRPDWENLINHQKTVAVAIIFLHQWTETIQIHFRATHPPIPVPSIRARSSGRTAAEKS